MPATYSYSLVTATARLILVCSTAIGMARAAPALAGVVVLSNRSEAKVACVVIQPDGRRTSHSLDPFDVVPLATDASVDVAFQNHKQWRRFTLQANGVYYFLTSGDDLDLKEDPLPGVRSSKPTPSPREGDSVALCTIPVKLLVDDKEPTVRRVWEKRYRERFAAASQIFERCCRVRFAVVAIDSWTSNSNATHMERLVEEFDRTVDPAPARLAVGFTAQYRALREDKHMGVSRGPFRSHILIREWGHGVTEPERLEILVHELGHFLGAAHSPEHQSAMRPDLSDRQTRARGYRIRFDAIHALVICLVAEELRSRPITRLSQLSPATKDALRASYQALVVRLPHDPAAAVLLHLLDLPVTPLPPPGSAAATRH